MNQWLDSIESLGEAFIPIDYVTPSIASTEEETEDSAQGAEDISEL